MKPLVFSDRRSAYEAAVNYAKTTQAPGVWFAGTEDSDPGFVAFITSHDRKSRSYVTAKSS